MADDDVYAKRIARDKDPWRVQMTQLKKREERLAKEIPRLYIAKQFKRFVAEREWRVPAYIERVADDDAHAPEDEGIEGATGAEAGAGHRGSVAEPPPDGRRTTRSRPTRLVA